MEPIKILLLGSTGSIGTSACRCVARHPQRFRLTGLAARNKADALVKQASSFNVPLVCITDPAAARGAALALPPDVRMLSGPDALTQMAAEADYDVLLNALVGAVGLVPTVTALKRNKRVALANKETLVIGGDHIKTLLDARSGQLVPIDSEHSAILQCLNGEDTRSVESIILTGSGGPFRELPPAAFASITPEQALRHPTWSMGAKITVDSATLANKGFELIEAHFLFSVPYDRLRVWIHPQSIVHSLVEFHDGAVIAQLGLPDMEMPIQYALEFPRRLPIRGRRLDLTEIGSLTFQPPDYRRFPCLRLCLEAARAGGMAPVVLNAANEAAVKRFLDREMPFTAIAEAIEESLAWNPGGRADTLDAILERDSETRAFVNRRKGH